LAESIAYGRSFRQGWWITLLVLTLSLGSTGFLTSRQPRIYHASATIVVTPNTGVEGTADILRSLETLERRSVIATFAKIPSTRETREAAAKRLGLEAGGLRDYRIEAFVLPNTNIIKVDVEGPDGQAVADVANAAAGVTREEVRRMYRIYTTKTLAEAVRATRPIHPDPRRNYVLAGILGAVLGVAATFVVGRLRGASAPGS